MKKIQLEAGKLFILSAPPAAGKSTLLKNNKIPQHMVISSDDIRSDVLGNTVGLDSIGEYNIPLYNDDAKVFTLVREMLSMRMKEKLTTFLDATATKDSERKNYVKIAKQYGMEAEILIFDVDEETCIEQDKKRKNRVGQKVISKFYDKFQKESKFDYQLVNSDSILSLNPLSLNDSKYDVIGDTHGFYTNFIEFAQKKLGYEMKNDLLVHPEGRKMLFLGDFVDRGPESMEMLIFVKRMCDNGHKAIAGNHENKLINFYRTLQEGRIHVSSRSSSETAMKFVKLDRDKQTELYDWLVSLKHYYVEDKFAFTHAGITHFDPLSTPRSFCIYGDQRHKEDRTEVDTIYDTFKQNGLNNYFLIRGHNSLTDFKQNSVISLDNNIGFENGTLNAIRLEDCIDAKNKNNNADLKDLIIKENVDYDYTAHMDKQFKIQTLLSKLLKEKLATKKLDDTGFLSIFKYSKSVFYNQSWSEDPTLLKCRGIVLDLAGNIVVHPFDKVFNYGEPNHLKEETAKNVDNNEKVIMVEKLNGYLGLITKHPYKKNQLLITTQGTFEKFQQDGELIDSQYAGYVRELITKEMYGKFLKYLNKNDVTLMFEVIHPEDKNNHIIHYDKSEEGLHLIGVRGKNLEDKVFTEELMDVVGKEIGCRRPHYFETTFGEAKKIIDASELEGHMIRAAKDQEYLCKFKTPHYLIIKFLSRMGKTQFNKMYDNPEKFKQHINVEEEFFPLIDYIVENVDKESFYKLTEDERKPLVKKAVKYTRDESLQEKLHELIDGEKLKKKIINKNKNKNTKK
jgi:predicted kinase